MPVSPNLPTHRSRFGDMGGLQLQLRKQISTSTFEIPCSIFDIYNVH